MNAENTTKLINKYEFLQNSLKVEEGQTMYSPFQMFLFECEDGWYNLLDSTFGEMLAAAWHPEELFIAQVKEKWAGLRIYFNCHSDDYDALSFIVDQAEIRSYKICEICGKEGSMRDLIGYQTLCDEDYQDKQDYYKKLTEKYRQLEKVDSNE